MTAGTHRPPPRRHLTSRGRRARWIALALGAVLVVVIVAVSLSGGSSQTPVQKCTSALQAMASAGLIGPSGLTGGSVSAIQAHGTPSDVRLLDSAEKACDSLSPAQEKQAADGVTP